MFLSEIRKILRSVITITQVGDIAGMVMTQPDLY